MDFRTGTGVAGFVAVIALSAFIGAQYGGSTERLLIVFFINLIAVLGIGIYSGNSGILSFGHLAFMGIGAYTSGILTMPIAFKQMTLPKLPHFLATVHFDIIPAIIVTIIFTMILALIIGLFISRLEGSAATIATLALLIITHGVIIGARDFTRGSQSFFGVPRETDIILAASGAGIAIIIASLFKDSVIGLKLRASRDDQIAAESMGVNVRTHRLYGWVISAGVVAFSGVLLGHFLGAFSVKKFYFVDTFMLLAMLIVGGMSTVSGALAGTVLITIVTESLRNLESGISILGISLPPLFGMTQIGIGLIILLVMYKKSGGLLERNEWDEMIFPRQSWKNADEPCVSNQQNDGARIERISCTGITKKFDGLVALDDVTLEFGRNEIVGIIGPNGSGKTTLLNVLSGVMEPTHGRVFLDDRETTSKTAYQMARHGISRTFQNIRLFSSLSVRNNILAAALINWPKLSLKTAGINASAATSAMDLAAKQADVASNLSYGDQRRVEIARALALQPSFIFLDEPAAGMNRQETDTLMNDLRSLREKNSIGILLIDHDLPLVMKLCDRVVVLNQGKLIAAGSPEEVQQHPAVIEAYLGRKK